MDYDSQGSTHQKPNSGKFIKDRGHSPTDIWARKELVRAYRYIKGVRFLYICFAILCGTTLTVGIFSLFSREVDFTKAIFATGYYFLMTIVTVFGAIKLSSHPLFWSLLIAILYTLDWFWTFVHRFPSSLLYFLNPFVLFWAICLLALWTAVPAMWHARSLLKLYPDLLISRKIKGKYS